MGRVGVERESTVFSSSPCVLSGVPQRNVFTEEEREGVPHVEVLILGWFSMLMSSPNVLGRPPFMEPPGPKSIFSSAYSWLPSVLKKKEENISLIMLPPACTLAPDAPAN